ncbi:hypothetical protein [Nocardia sp. NPDC052566]|uniref:hypothetical protein n=1 Tax=Nocardia sp. NPDC052566 TaxID=3364330 RepID=UPI0037CB1208
METLIITCGAEVADEVDARLRANDITAQRSPRRNIDGAAATTWVLVAGVAVQSAPAILNSLRDLLTRKQVGEFTFGDVTISNPSPEDVAELIEVLRTRGQ